VKRDSGALWPFRRSRGGAPLVYAHRGAHETASENTLAAFAAAASAGADGIELDVRLSRSGELVVLHDPTLERVTGGADTRAAAELTAAELARVDVGGGERVPRLVDALAVARERGLVVNVEMKRDVPDRAAVVRAVARVLRGWDPAHPILVSSFDPLMLAGLRLARPKTPVAQLVTFGVFRERVFLAARPPFADAANVERTLTSPARLRALSRLGVFVNVWTVNDPREAADLANLGVDGVITDAPAAVRAALSTTPRA
jgi:glycerophosphoryl diester phosphodiesterase